MAAGTHQKSGLRGVVYALIATLTGLAMVGGGMYGLIFGGKGEDKSSSVGLSSISGPDTSTDFSAIGASDDCGDLDPRLAGRTKLSAIPVRGTGGGEIGLRCGGDTAFFDVDVGGVDGDTIVFTEVWLYASKKRSEKIGTVWHTGGRIQGLAGVPPGLDLRDFKFVVLVPREIDDTRDEPRPIAFKARL
jgi:hypothetical protein